MTCELIENNKTLLEQLDKNRKFLMFDLLYAKEKILNKIEKDE